MNWNYDELTDRIAHGYIDVDREAIPYLLDEARKRDDGDVIADIASTFYEEVDSKRYFELVEEAADLGSAKANFWLGHDYLSGEKLPRDYEKAYDCFIKGKDVEWAPIDPEEDADNYIEGDVVVTAEGLVSDSYGDIGWWLFVLGKHPSRALKCGIADWYMKQGGEKNREKALKLFEESANEGFKFAVANLIKCYSSGETKDPDKERYWRTKAVEHGFDLTFMANLLDV